MAVRGDNDYPIDPNVVSGTELSEVLNRAVLALDTNNSGVARPIYAEAGTWWIDTSTTNELGIMMFDGVQDIRFAVINTATGDVQIDESGGTAWLNNRNYSPGHIVGFGKLIYVALEQNFNEQPDISDSWLPQQNILSILAGFVTQTVVDVFIYNANDDSDGGQWRNRCGSLSWYNEPLNTATRGRTKKFPLISLVVAEPDNVTIYDLTTPDIPMWMIIEVGPYKMIGNESGSSVAMINGVLVHGGNIGTVGLSIIDFLADENIYNKFGNDTIATYMGLPIAERNDGVVGDQITKTLTSTIINDRINGIAVIADPDIEPNAATRIKRPLIALATDGGISIVRDFENSVSLTDNRPSGATTINIPDTDTVQWSGNSDNFPEMRGIFFHDLPVIDTNYTSFTDIPRSFYDNVPAITKDGFFRIKGSCGELLVIGYEEGVTLLSEDLNDPLSSMVAYITNEFSSGFLVGDIRGAFLANSITIDRSIQEIDLTIIGTITEQPAHPGSELMVYSGFSVSDRLVVTNNVINDSLFCCGWVLESGQWTFKHGLVTDGVLDGVSISGNTLEIAGFFDKSLIRISANNLTPDQVDLIIYAEGRLFKPGALCLIDDVSSSILSIDCNSDTGLTTVSTDNIVNVFDMLNRVEGVAVNVDQINSISSNKSRTVYGGNLGYFVNSESEHLEAELSKSVPGFESGTRLAFNQESAPVGWSQDDTFNDAMLRVVDGIGGGKGGIHSAILNDKVPPHTHVTDSDGQHTHTITAVGSGTVVSTGAGTSLQYRVITSSGNGLHSHNVEDNIGENWTPKYVDLIICTKV